MIFSIHSDLFLAYIKHGFKNKKSIHKKNKLLKNIFMKNKKKLKKIKIKNENFKKFGRVENFLITKTPSFFGKILRRNTGFLRFFKNPNFLGCFFVQKTCFFSFFIFLINFFNLFYPNILPAFLLLNLILQQD